MGWITPKTDWAAKMDEKGRYTGDYFNTADYNRIKSNIQYLRDLAVSMYADFDIQDMGSDKGYTDYPYADEINRMETNLGIIAAHTFQKNYGEGQIYTDNGAFIDFSELNRIENAMLDLYNHLCSQYEGRRMLEFMLGGREVF